MRNVPGDGAGSKVTWGKQANNPLIPLGCCRCGSSGSQEGKTQTAPNTQPAWGACWHHPELLWRETPNPGTGYCALLPLLCHPAVPGRFRRGGKSGVSLSELASASLCLRPQQLQAGISQPPLLLSGCSLGAGEAVSLRLLPGKRAGILREAHVAIAMGRYQAKPALMDRAGCF